MCNSTPTTPTRRCCRMSPSPCTSLSWTRCWRSYPSRPRSWAHSTATTTSCRRRATSPSRET
ncbi:hypothetical protein EVA_11291 [gut metagenome]|uniref:Uncharacterized protein n=1 Tax=gut metagenome TaxID=749906 RepID=J9GFP2_9ZZZZ